MGAEPFHMRSAMLWHAPRPPPPAPAARRRRAAPALPGAGFRSTRRTKLIATIGPACDSVETLEAMAVGGMNVARLNLAHGGWVAAHGGRGR